MATHETFIVRSGEGVLGKCSCKQRQAKPVETRQLAEDWCMWHMEQVARAQADPGKHLSGPYYLAYLQEKAANLTLPERERALWQQLADEHERRVRAPAPKGVPGLPKSPNAQHNTGVETEPLW